MRTEYEFRAKYIPNFDDEMVEFLCELAHNYEMKSFIFISVFFI